MSLFRSGIIAVAILFLAGSVAAQAQNTGDSPIFVDKSNPAALKANGAAARLIAKAARQGSIRVIAGLNVSLADEDGLSPAEAKNQAAQLSAMQDGVLGDLVGRKSGDGISRFSYVPYVALSLTPAQISRALGDGRIANLQEDVLFDAQGYNIVITNDKHVVKKKGFDGSGQTIAILDTGIDEGLSDFSGRIVSEACFSTNSSTSQSFCPGHAASSTAPGSGKNCTTAIKTCEHGTEMASAAAGDGSEIVGFAPGAGIISIQIFSKVTSGGKCTSSDPCAQSFQSDQVKGLEQVYTLRKSFNIAAANLSIGHGAFNAVCDLKFPSLAAIITKLRHANILTTTPAGNETLAGSINAPGCISTAVAVGSTDRTDTLSTFSNFASMIAVLAPGSGVRTVQPGGTTHDVSGTSVSAAEVAGTAAVLFNTNPSTTANAVENSLKCGVVPVSTTLVANLSLQRLDVLAAHNYVTKPPTANKAQTWTFGSASDGDLWTPILGTWKTKDGAYNLVTPDTTQFWNGSWFPNCAGGVDVTSTMTRIDSDPNTGWNSGILFDALVQKSTFTVSGYYFAYNKQKLPNTTSPAGEAVLMRLDSFVFSTTVAAVTYLCPYAPAPVNIGGANTIRAVNNGGTITVYVNGTQFCSVTDTTYPSGLVMMLAAYPFPLTPTQSLAIDDIKIKTLPPPQPPPSEVEADVTQGPAPTAAHAPMPGVAGVTVSASGITHN